MKEKFPLIEAVRLADRIIEDRLELFELFKQGYFHLHPERDELSFVEQELRNAEHEMEFHSMRKTTKEQFQDLRRWIQWLRNLESTLLGQVHQGKILEKLNWNGQLNTLVTLFYDLKNSGHDSKKGTFFLEGTNDQIIQMITTSFLYRGAEIEPESVKNVLGKRDQRAKADKRIDADKIVNESEEDQN